MLVVMMHTTVRDVSIGIVYRYMCIGCGYRLGIPVLYSLGYEWCLQYCYSWMCCCYEITQISFLLVIMDAWQQVNDVLSTVLTMSGLAVLS